MEGVRTNREDYAAVLADLGFVSNSYLASLKRYGTGGGDADRNANVGRVTKAALVAGFYPQAGAASTHHPIYPTPPNTPHVSKRMCSRGGYK